MRRLATIGALMLAAPSFAFAHVSVRPRESKPGAEERYTVRVPTEGAVATTQVLEVPAGVTVLSVPTPPEIISNYRIDPDHLATPNFAIDVESWLEQQRPYDGPLRPQPQNMIYTSGTTGHPKGVRRHAPTPEQIASSERMRGMIYGLKPGARTMALDLKTHSIYLCTAKQQPAPPGQGQRGRGRRAFEPNSFVVLVVGK